MGLLLILRGSYFGGVTIRKAFIITAGALAMASPSSSLAADEKPYCTADKLKEDPVKHYSEIHNDCNRKLFNFIVNNPHLKLRFADEKTTHSSRIMMFRGMGGIVSLFKDLYNAEDGIHAAAEDVYKTADALGLIKRQGNNGYVEILNVIPDQMDPRLMANLIAGASPKDRKNRVQLGRPFRSLLEPPAENSQPAVPGAQVEYFYKVFFDLGDELARLKQREAELAGAEGDLTYQCRQPTSYDINALTKAARTIVSTFDLRHEQRAKSGGAAHEAALDYFDWELSERLARDFAQVTLIFNRADELLNVKKGEGLANIPAGSPNNFKKLDTGKLQAVFDAPPRR